MSKIVSTVLVLSLVSTPLCLAKKKRKYDAGDDKGWSTQKKVAVGAGATGAVAAIITGLATFGFIGEKYLRSAKLLYHFRDENSTAGTWWYVPRGKRTLARKWEGSLPLERLKILRDGDPNHENEELRGLGDSYDLPKKFRSLVKEWKQGELQKPGSSGFAYPYLSFVEEAFKEEGALTELKLLLSWWFVNRPLFNFMSKIMYSADFIEQIDYYISRVKYLRMIIEDSNDYDKEAALLDERTAHGHDMQAYQNMGAQQVVTVRNLPADE